MPFGVVSGIGRGMGVLGGGGDHRREWAVLWVNFGCLIVTNGAFATQLFSKYCEDLLLLLLLFEIVGNTMLKHEKTK